MAEEASPSRLRLGLNTDGDQVLMIGSDRETLSEGAVDNLIHMLNIGKADSKDVKNASKKIKGILKQYNTIGKPIDSGNLKTIAEGAPVTEGVIDDEAA